MKSNQKGFTILEIILLVMVVGFICGVVGYVVSTKKNASQKSDSSSAQQTPSSAKKVEAKTPPDLIDYTKTNPPSGVTVESKQDAVKLVDASDSFKKFILFELESLQSRASSDCPNPANIGVAKIYKDSFATGGFASCGGAATIWKKDGSIWKQVWAGQQGLSCDVADKFKIPQQLYSDCLDSNFQAIPNSN